MRSRPLAHLALLGVFVSFAGTATAGQIRATCTQNGAMIYREDIPEDATAERRLAIAASRPQAMCIFLKVGATPPEQRMPAGLGDEIPLDVLKGAVVPQGGADESLATALSVLSGRSDAPDLKPLPPFANDVGTPVSAWAAADASDDSRKPLNLTVGIYRNMEMQDVVAHWKVMQKDTIVLARMTPSIATVGDVTLLSVEDVPYEDASKLCVEAKKHGEGCIAAY